MSPVSRLDAGVTMASLVEILHLAPLALAALLVLSSLYALVTWSKWGEQSGFLVELT